VYPAILAALFWIFGATGKFVLAAILLDTIVQAACLTLLLQISARCFSTWVPGAIGAGLFIVCSHPVPQWENWLACLGMEAVVAGALAALSSTVGGIITGIAWLISPPLIPASIAAMFFLRGFKRTCASAAVAILCVSPWIIRNAVVFHAPVFLRDDFGLQLYISNNDLARPEQAARLGHPSQNPSVAADLIRFGEPAYFDSLRSNAVQWIRDHPGQFLRLTGGRIRLWWTSSWFAAVLNLLALSGIWLARRERIGKAAAAAILLFPAPYYLVQFEARYTYPVLWASALMAGYAAVRLTCFVRTSFRPARQQRAH
jgi:hypothetical protein